MRRLLRVLTGAIVLVACSNQTAGPNDPGSPKPAAPCIDRDGDGFGQNCAYGVDCNDGSKASTNECRTCAYPEAGCDCAEGTQPIACFLTDTMLEGGDVMCREGTRYCRNGLWSACEDVHSYVVTPDSNALALISGDAAPVNCSMCDVKCFKVRDQLLATGGPPGSGVSYSGDGGLQLAQRDSGMGTGGTGGSGGTGAVPIGCTGLTACCSTLTGAPEAQSACLQALMDASDDAECNAALRVYCPSVITGPLDGCKIGASDFDIDCDGIPDALDECTPDTIATNPDCNGSVLPISTTNNQTIFHVLDKGETGTNSLEVGFRVQNADVYFLMDMSNTMSEERDRLIAELTTGNVVECALLKNCCETLTGSDKTNCDNLVATNNSTNCRNQTGLYCGAMNAHLMNCPDLDFDGLPDNGLKDQGLIGAIRCLVGTSHFGAGSFVEIPFRDGLSSILNDTSGIRDRGNTDENAFRHYVDMTQDVNMVKGALQRFTTNGNLDYPESSMIALHSLVSGKGQMFGHQSASVPERLGAGCPANTFGYPCFRDDAIPIVLLFTDDPMNNGPPVYTPAPGNSPATYDANYTLNGRRPTSGIVRYTPRQAEAFATAYNLGDVRGQFVGVGGDLTFMSGDYPSAVTGCSAETGAPDAVYRFTISPDAGLTPARMKFAINNFLDNDSPIAYNNASNPRSPATAFPVVITLYRGIPTSIQPPADVGETRINPIPSGPDLTYLTYVGTSAGTTQSAPGFLGGVSGCGADGATNEVIFTFRPIANAHIVIDASESDFDTVVSLHEGKPSDLPRNPTTLGTDRVVLVGSTGNNNDTFDNARRVDGANDTAPAVPKINGDYVTYIGNTLHLEDQGTSSAYNLPEGKSGRDDYDDTVVACGVNSEGPDAIFQFRVDTPTRVRLDTEGSKFRTALSLHDNPPPRSYTNDNISGNYRLQDARRIGVAPTYPVHQTSQTYNSDMSGTASSPYPAGDFAPLCGVTPTSGSKESFYSFTLTEPTHLQVSAEGDGAFQSAVFLYNSAPGSISTVTVDNTHETADTAANLFDIFSRVDTVVEGADMRDGNNDYAKPVVPCNTYSGLELSVATVDQVYKFTPTANGTARIVVRATGSHSGLHAVAVFDGKPPASDIGAPIDLFDASAITPAPGPLCTAYSRGGHIYWFCASGVTWAQARTNCANVLGGHLLRVDNAAENTFAAATRGASAQAWIGGTDTGTGTTRNWFWADPNPVDRFWSGGATGSVIVPFFANWYSGEPSSTSEDCAAYYYTAAADLGKWADRACGSSYHYICEDPSLPTPAPPESEASPAAIPDPVGTVRTFRGSTRRMEANHTTAGLMGPCGADPNAPDAVLRFVPSATREIAIDTTGSSFPAVVALFESNVSAGTFMGCDGPGVNPGVDVGMSATMGGTEPLKRVLNAGTTYYAVIKGPASSRDGSYRIKFTDTASATADGERLACAMETAMNPAVVEADFYANHTYYIVVERNAASTPLVGVPETYSMTVNSLYRNRVELENPQGLNETSSSAFALPDPYRSKVTVGNASTVGMAANYTVQPDTMGGTLPGMCGGQSSDSPDAVYTFTPSISTNVKLSVAMPAGAIPAPGQDAVIALYKGKPGSSASTTNLDVPGGNTNEDTATAQVVNVAGGAQTILGDTAVMGHDIDASLLSCGADPNGHDAVFKFSLAQETEVEIDASASVALGLADPVIALFHDVPLERPDPTPLAFDTYMAASAGPTPPPATGWPHEAVGDWKVWSGDMALLTPANQVQVMMSNTSNTNEVVNPATRVGAFQLGDIANTRVTVGGGNTTGMNADYGEFCGFPASADSPDAIYEFRTSQAGRVRVSTERPAPGFNTLVKVWDGTRGAPVRKVDQGETLLDLNAVSGCGDGVLNFGEECDPLPRTPDDGCTDTCQFEAGWHCDPSLQDDDDDICDCGCGDLDPDCYGTDSFLCMAYPIGSCAERAPQFETIQAGFNAYCVYPEGIWHCLPGYLTDAFCDCACGAPDPACSTVDKMECDRWTLSGSCASAFDDIRPLENWLCLDSGSDANTNDEINEAVNIDLSAGGTRRYLGDSTGMQSDLPSPDALAACGAADDAADAMFGFSLRRDTEVQIQALGPGRPVLALYDSGALGVPPPLVPLGNDEAVQADVNPSPSPQISGSWVRYTSDLSDFTISNQPQTAISNQDNINVDTPTRLISPINRRVTVNNASTRTAIDPATGAMPAAGNYAASTCGGVNSAFDEVYSFVPDAEGVLRISTSYPQTEFSPVLALYDGSGGRRPLENSALASTSKVLGTAHEWQSSAELVALEDGIGRAYTGSTAGMTADVSSALMQCGVPTAGPDAVWSFSLASPMDVEVTADGWGDGAALALFDSPIERPSVTVRRSLAAARVQIYDIDHMPGQPEPGCAPYDWNLRRYWLCNTERTWDSALAMCEAVGQSLVTIDNATENIELYNLIAPTAKHYHIGLRAADPYLNWGPGPNVGAWASGASSSFRNWVAGEPNQVENAGARMRYDLEDAEGGQWTDTASSWGRYRYICEQASPPPAVLPPTGTSPQVVDLFGSRRRFVGSTKPPSPPAAPVNLNTVTGFTNCGAHFAAPDAVFSFSVPYETRLTVEFSTPTFGSAIGLFKNGINTTGYVSAGSVCRQSSAAAPQINGVLLTPDVGGSTYYVVLTGSGATNSGAYDITFSAETTADAAFTLANDTLVDATAPGRGFGPIEKQWIVKKADMADLTTDLIAPRTVDMPGSPDTNSNHVTGTVRSLNNVSGTTAGEQITVINASTENLGGDYAAPACGVSADANDAIFRFRPANDTSVRIRVNPTAHDAVVALYDGSGGEFPLLKGQVAVMPEVLPNTNESQATAKLVTIGDPKTFVGNLAAMMNDVPTTDAQGRPWDTSNDNGGESANVCSAAPLGKDAFFRFDLAAPTNVVIDTSGTDFAHTVALWETNPITAPAPMTLSHNTRAAALAAPLTIGGGWFVLEGNTGAAGFTPGADTRVTRTAGTDFANDDGVQDLGTLAADTQIVTLNADTAAAAVDADYLRQCGGSDTADDIIFKFRSGAVAQDVQINVDNPAAGFPAVLQLYDGAMGDPATAGEIDPPPTAISGNESRALAYNVVLGTAPLAFSGDTSGFASDTQSASLYDRAANHGGDAANMCNAGSTSKDAFFRFNLPTPAEVRVKVAGDATAYAHTLALYRETPAVTLPAAAAGGHDTRALAFAAADVPVDDQWLHYSTNMSTLGIDGLTEAPLRAGFEFQNAAGVQDLHGVAGTISGKQYQFAAAALANNTGSGSSYPAPMCGGATAANDMIFKLRPTTATTLRVGVDNPTPGFAPVLAVYEGLPLTSSEADFTTTDLDALGNPNETFATARPVLAGARATFNGDAAAMASDYAGSQFATFAGTCSPDAAGPDAFVEVEVVTIPKAARDNLGLWLDAADEDYLALSGTAVSAWNDKSKLGFNTAQATMARQPQRQLRGNGYAIEFTPGGDLTTTDSTTEDSLLRDPAVGDSPVSVFVVWSMPNAAFLQDAALLATDVPAGAAGFKLAMSADRSTGTARLQYRDSGSAAVDMSAAFAATGAVSPMLAVATHAADGSIETRLNGGLAALATGSGRAGGTQFQRFRVGVKSDATRAVPMDLHELIVVKRAVTQAEREQIEGYLAHKWSLSASLPAAHPYKSGPPTRMIEVSSAGTAFDHALSFFSREPMSRPTATAGTAYDEPATAITNRLPAADGTWHVRNMSSAGMTISGLTAATLTEPTNFTNANSDHHAGGVPSLGSVAGRTIKTVGANSAGLAADYPTSTLVCSSDDAAPDAIYSFTTSAASTRVAIRAEAAGFEPVVGLYNGASGFPRDASSTSAPPVKLGFVPSNYDHGAYAYNNAVTLNCAGTTTFNSTTGTFTSYPCGGLQPEISGPVAQLGGTGPQVYVLRMDSLTIGSSHTLALVGDKPVILAVDGNALIQGTIHANASGTTPGAGGNWSCGTSAGTNGSGSSSAGGGGGGGGGYRTSGGNGGDGDVNNNGVAGVTRGNSSLVPLIGGCAGGRGGGCTTNGGAGGGAFQLSVNGTLTLPGILRANGAAGTSGCGSEGGGTGGGSGGGILIEAVALSTTGSTIQTSGGSGGNGSGGGSGGAGSTSASNAGGTGASSGTNGGGGGGGGYGRIWTVDASSNDNESVATAQPVTIGAVATYEGNTSSMAANIAASLYDTSTKVCHAAGTPDAMFTFTLGAPTPVRISAVGSKFDTTLSLWNNSATAAALYCDFGTAAAGPEIIETLPAGTYYVGITGNSNTGGATSGDYKITFENTSLTSAATPIACSTTSVEEVVSPGTYYVIVKGAAAADAGPYTLRVDDVTSIDDMACPAAGATADRAAPDTYVGFSVTGTKDVAIDLENSALTAVFELWREGGASRIACAANGSAAAQIVQRLTPGNYYIKVRAVDASHGRGEQPFQISIRDEDVQRASDCDDGAIAAGTTLTKTLAAGTYYVGVKPQAAEPADAYSIAVRDLGFATSGGNQVACETDRSLDVAVAANTDYYVLVKGQTAADKGSFGLTVTDIGALAGRPTDIGCGADLAAPDAYYEFVVGDAGLPSGQDVEVTITNAFNGAFQLYRDAGGDGDTSNDSAVGACSTTSLTYADLVAGRYYVVAKGRTVAGGAAGQPLQVSVRDLDGLGAIACADGTSGAPAVIESSSLGSLVNAQGQLPAGSYYVAFSGQIGQNGAYEVQFTDLDQVTGSSATALDCSTDGSINATLAPGRDYYVVVKGDGAASRGPFTLAVTDVTNVEEFAGCPTDLAAPDAYAAFRVVEPERDVRIDMSGLDPAMGLNGSYQVFHDDGTPVASCPCGSIAVPRTCTLPTGNYYVAFRSTIVASGNGQRPFQLVLRDEDALGALACGNGGIGSGRRIERPLDPGTYYVGIIPTAANASMDLDYRLLIKDAASTVGVGAPQIACGDDEIETTVNGGSDYYVIVKGKNVADQGAYELTLQDLSGVPGFGCGDSTTSGDAFYSFQVTQPNTQVTIDTEQSPLETVIALFPGGGGTNFTEDVVDNTTGMAPPDGKPDDMIACDATSGAGMRSRIDRTLQPGLYYVVVRAKAGTADENLPFQISVRDSGSMPSIACDAALGIDQARVRQTLQPGTYYVALSGLAASATQSGNYDVRFRDYAGVANAAPQLACGDDTLFYTVRPSDVGKPLYLTVKGDTAAAQGNYKLTVENYQLGAGMGCGANQFSPDVFYKFSLSAAETDLVIDVDGALDPVIAIYPESASYFGTNYAQDINGVTVGCDDNSGGGSAAKISARMPPGDYYLVVKGKGGASEWGAISQPFQVSIRDATNKNFIECADAGSPGTLTKRLPAGDYKVVVSSEFVNGGQYDIRFTDLSAGSTSNQATVAGCGAGTVIFDAAANTPYYVAVKGDSATEHGPYTLTVENVNGGANMGCNADPEASDAFYKFKVTSQIDVTVDTVGSDLDTVLALYPGNATVFGTNYARDAFNQVIGCDDDGAGDGDSTISATLAPGEYYAVVKGRSAMWEADQLPFQLSIRDSSATRAITCEGTVGAGQPKITQTLPAGDYTLVLSDSTTGMGNGGKYSVTIRDRSSQGTEGGTLVNCAVRELAGMDGPDPDTLPDGVPVDAGEDYYVVVKGVGQSGSPSIPYAGPYELTVRDAFSASATAGSTAIGCSVEGDAPIDGVYPPGSYYAVVTGTGGADGKYSLNVRDVDAFSEFNRIACASPDVQDNNGTAGVVAEAGSNETAAIEADLDPGMYYAVVKGDGPGQTGSYTLNVRDVNAWPDHQLACGNASANEQLEYDVKANTDYTVLLKGANAGEQGNFNIKLYDELGLQGGGGQRIDCATVTPPIGATSNCRADGDSCTSAGQCCSSKCRSGRCAPPIEADLGADTYYLTVKGRKANEKGHYELQIGDSNAGSTAKYVPPTWSETRQAVLDSKVKILPVLSCESGSRCDGTQKQAEVLALLTGSKDPVSGVPLVKRIRDDGQGIGSDLALAVRDMANYLSMDITLGVEDNPGFEIAIQKCLNASMAGQDVCLAFTTGCTDTSPLPPNTIKGCRPGSEPKFMVSFTNPLDPNAVPPNPADANGGYHFKLKIVGDNQYLLDQIPVYIIPTEITVPVAPPAGAGTYETMGTYEQQVFGAGCNYYQVEGERAGANSCRDGIDNAGSPPGADRGVRIDQQIEGESTAADSCTDGMDNNGDNRADRVGKDNNNDGDTNDPGDFAPDPACLAGACTDGVDNDNDGMPDAMDPSCVVYPADPGCQPGSCLDGIDNDGDGAEDIMDPDCQTTDRQQWSDLFFQADIPPGTSIDFDVCTADTADGLSACTGSRYSRVAHITSATGACATNADCQDVNLGSGVVRDGFCGVGGQCQFITPQKRTQCVQQSDCPNGLIYENEINSYCDTSIGQCIFTTPPADIGANLMSGQNGQPFVKVKVTMTSDSTGSRTPTLFDWYLTYICRGMM